MHVFATLLPNWFSVMFQFQLSPCATLELPLCGDTDCTAISAIRCHPSCFVSSWSSFAAIPMSTELLVSGFLGFEDCRVLRGDHLVVRHLGTSKSRVHSESFWHHPFDCKRSLIVSKQALVLGGLVDGRPQKCRQSAPRLHTPNPLSHLHLLHHSQRFAARHTVKDLVHGCLDASELRHGAVP